MSALTRTFVFPASRALVGARRDGDFSLPQSRLTGLTKAFAFAVVFIAGWYLCLPETEFIQVPWWAAKLSIGPNILVHEAVFGVYLVVGGLRDVWRGAVAARYITLPVSVYLVLLAAWCATASLLGPLPLHDAGRSARLIVMALLLLAVTHWAAGNPLFILRTFLLGMMGGSVVNLVLTFLNPVIVAGGVLPRLLGQNAPGPPMGIAVCLAAWLILVSRSRRDTILGLSVAIICGIGVMISYSKTGMLAAGIGFASIAIVSGRVAPSRRGRVLVAALFGIVLGVASYLRGESGQRIWSGWSGMLQEKVASASSESSSVQERWSYVLGVTEIVLTHPIGVGYSGFRDAMIETEAYASGLAADETAIDAEQSNPHSLFLYYASAGGIVGGALGVAIFILLCRALLSGVGLYGLGGTLLAGMFIVAYVVLAISVAYLFNSAVMLIPAGVSAGILAHVRRVDGPVASKTGDLAMPAPAT